MATKEKSFNIEGTIYAKNARVVQGKKDPTKEYTFNTIILEVTSGKTIERDGQSKFITKTTLIEFDVAQWIPIDDYSVGDFIDIRFIIEGNEFTRKDGTKGFITKLRASFIKYADLQGTKDNKVSVNAMSDINELPQAKESVFIAPDPGADDDEMSDLPF